MKALSGVRVIDLATDTAGAYASRLLAALGADIVRVEPPGGDELRRTNMRMTDEPDGGLLAAYLHAGKRSVVLDHRDEGGRNDLLRLLRTADVIIETGRPGEWADAGVSLSALLEERPALVICSITPFGQDGPRADWRVTPLTAFAAGGQMSLCGDPDRPPLKAAGDQARYQAGIHGFGACLTGLYSARRTGVGDHFDISMQEVQAAALEVPGPMSLVRGFDSKRSGNRTRPTWGIYPCADGYVGVAAMERQNGTVFHCIGHPHLADDPAFANLRSDETAIEVTEALILEWTMARTARQVFDESQAYRGPFSMIPTPADLLQWPPLREAGFWTEVDHPVLGQYTTPGVPFTLDGERPTLGAPPLLGEHTTAVREELAAAEVVEPAAPGAAVTPPFAGIRVLDLSQVWAGPYAARFAADLGGDVIHIEGPAFADAVRATGKGDDPRWFNKGPVFNEYNRNKRGLAMDLRRPEGLEAFRRLVAESDVVIENWSVGVAERLGIGYEDLRAINPRVVFVQMPAFSQTPPESERMGYGPTVEQMASLPTLQGYEDGPPHKSGIAYGDPTAGSMGAALISLGLLQRETTGEGAHIVLSQRDNIVAMIGEFYLAESLGQRTDVRLGNRDRAMAPHGVYRGRDDSGRFREASPGVAGDELTDTWLALAVDSDEAWQALRSVITDERLSDPSYEALAGRLAGQDAIDVVISEYVRHRDPDELAQLLQRAGVSASPVLTPLMLANDSHLLARGFITEYDHAEAGVRRATQVPWRMTRYVPPPLRPAPCFGEHNREVLQEVGGYTDDEIEALAANGILADAPRNA